MTSSKIRADLHYHGPIGFQKEWLRAQGYLGVNPLELMCQTAQARGIELFALTSQELNIPRGSVHDRFNHILSLGKDLDGYEITRLDDADIAARIRTPSGFTTYMLNGQTAICEEDGRNIDFLVVGGNDIPNHLTIPETSRLAQGRGYIRIAEHPLVTSHQGMGYEKLTEYAKEFYDAIEGFNAQLVWPFPKFTPKFGESARVLNERAIEFAVRNNIPWVANSDGHRIEDLGTAYNIFDRDIVRGARSGRDILTNLREEIRDGEFQTHEQYINIFGWFKWVSTFIALKDKVPK